MFWPAFLSGEDSFSSDVSGGVVFLPGALRDPETRLIIVMVRAELLVALSVRSVFFGLSIVMPVSADVCVKDV